MHIHFIEPLTYNEKTEYLNVKAEKETNKNNTVKNLLHSLFPSHNSFTNLRENKPNILVVKPQNTFSCNVLLCDTSSSDAPQ